MSFQKWYFSGRNQNGVKTSSLILRANQVKMEEPALWARTLPRPVDDLSLWEMEE